ncbi:ROK family protein [Rubrivirga sp. S365]|uniref:ROK family protein n=1 Tax=Rubrivirga litoralis TaxID=3075598 RepID=A0ABU3BQT0_9BACT|nr:MULTISPECIES: ROK family protein [unclassified Rubrivirga]MDT0631625.1 ROK family protein [Rubrivirga sp. F394]MDT7857270.1 ROK family protein [Rubrivirga sp. S365]
MADAPLHAVGVDLGGTNLKVALVEREGGIVQSVSRPTGAERGPDHVLDQIADGVAQVLEGAAPPEIVGVGIGAPGAVSLDRTTVREPPNLPEWRDVHLPDALGPRLAARGVAVDGPVIVENDANAAALGSAFYGAGRPFDSFVMVTLGTGVGGAIVVNDRLFRGSTGAAGEIGHMSIDYEGPYDRAGVSGAIEAYLGQRFLSHHARYQLLARETHLHQTAGRDLTDVTPQHLHRAAVAGDPAAREVLAWAGHKLGVLLGSVVSLLDIRKIVVGGGVSQAGDYLLDPARETIERFVMPPMLDGVEIVRETRGNEVALLGAARLAFEHHEDRPAQG